MKTFKLNGIVYGTIKDTNKVWGCYEELERKELGVFKFRNLLEAEIFFVANYPDYFMGGSVVEVKDGKGGDFSLFCIPDYYESIYHTTDRKLIAEKELEMLLSRE